MNKMENKEQQDVESVKSEIKQYKYAHLVVHCGKCGSKYILEKDVEGGVQINLPTASNAEIVLVCKECKNTMGMFYVESDGSSKTNKEEIVIESDTLKDLEVPEVVEDSTIVDEGVYEPKMEIVN